MRRWIVALAALSVTAFVTAQERGALDFPTSLRARGAAPRRCPPASAP